MPRHLISDAHEWINEIPTVPTYYLAKPQPRERAWDNQRGKKTLYEWECRRNRACRAFTSMLCLAPGAVQTINLPGGAIFIGALYMLEAILYIYIYVCIYLVLAIGERIRCCRDRQQQLDDFLLEYRAYLHHVSNCVSVLLHWRRICRRAMFLLGKPMVSTSFSQNNHFIHQSPTNLFNTDITYHIHISYSLVMFSFESPLRQTTTYQSHPTIIIID